GTGGPGAWWLVMGSRRSATGHRLATPATTHHSPRIWLSTTHHAPRTRPSPALPSRHVKPPPLRNRGTADDVPVQEPGDDHAQEAVKQREGHERDDQPGHGGHRVAGFQNAVDHPRLPAQLGHHPARFY